MQADRTPVICPSRISRRYGSPTEVALSEDRKKAGNAVASSQQVIEAKSFPPGSSAQKAELAALVQALISEKDRRSNIYTDSRYAFLVLHTHAAILKERS